MSVASIMEVNVATEAAVLDYFYGEYIGFTAKGNRSAKFYEAACVRDEDGRYCVIGEWGRIPGFGTQGWRDRKVWRFWSASGARAFMREKVSDKRWTKRYQDKTDDESARYGTAERTTRVRKQTQYEVQGSVERKVAAPTADETAQITEAMGRARMLELYSDEELAQRNAAEAAALARKQSFGRRPEPTPSAPKRPAKPDTRFSMLELD